MRFIQSRVWGMCGVRSKVVLLYMYCRYSERIPSPTVSYRNRRIFATIYSHHIPALSWGNRTFPADARNCTSRQVFPAALKGLPSCHVARPHSEHSSDRFVKITNQTMFVAGETSPRPPSHSTVPRHKLRQSFAVYWQYHQLGFVAKS